MVLKEERMKTIKWGFLATGRICRWFAAALSVTEGAQRYAVASRTEEKAVKFAAEYGFEKAYGSYEALLQDPEVDIVYIGTPVGEHYKHIRMCLEAGKNVLCEKSLTINAAQAREVIALAREKKLFLMEAMWMKCQPVFREVRKWAEDGLLGEVQAADVTFYTACGKGHRLYNYETAGGALLDLGIYPVTYACSFLGYHPEEVLSSMVIGEKKVDYFDSVVLRYPGGKVAHLASGLGSERIITSYLLGSKGRVTLQNDQWFYQAQKAQLLDFDNNVIAEANGPFLKNGYEFEAMEVQKCLLEGRTESELVPLDETIAVMELLDRIRDKAGFRYSFE